MKNTLSYDDYLSLVKQVNEYRNHIHLFENDEISESALDDLKHKITIFEETYPEKVSKNSPNYTIAGGVSEKFEKFTHKTRMVSLNDIFDLEELQDWEKRYQDYAERNLITLDADVSYMCEPKIDGLAISLHYKHGELIHGVTRGDSYIGEDITVNVLQVDSIPKTIPDERYQEIRGELFFSKQAFETLNDDIKTGKKTGKMGKSGVDAQFSNPRNAASGTIRQLDSSIVKDRKLSFIAYGVIIYDEQ